MVIPQEMHLDVLGNRANQPCSHHVWLPCKRSAIHAGLTPPSYAGAHVVRSSTHGRRAAAWEHLQRCKPSAASWAVCCSLAGKLHATMQYQHLPAFATHHACTALLQSIRPATDCCMSAGFRAHCAAASLAPVRCGTPLRWADAVWTLSGSSASQPRAFKSSSVCCRRLLLRLLRSCAAM